MIFIAGATGFVGGHLVKDLIAKGHKVKCLVRSDKAAAALSSQGTEVFRGGYYFCRITEGNPQT